MTDAHKIAAGLTRVLHAFRRFDLRYWLRSRLIPSRRYHVINTGLTPGWHDVDERMLYGCMALLCSYVEDEQGGEVGFPNVAGDGGETDQEVLAIYRWWKYQRPADRQREDDLLMVWHEASPRSDEAHQVACAAEDANDNRDQEMLHRLIDVRRSTWT